MRSKHSDSFAAHFVGHVLQEWNHQMKSSGRWWSTKSYGKATLLAVWKHLEKRFVHLAWERIKISKVQQLEENYLINLCYKIFGACRHNMTRFHRVLKEKQSMKITSTDEGIKPERVNKMDGKGRGDKEKSPRLAHFHDPPLGDVNVWSPTSRKLVCVWCNFGKLVIARLLIKLVSLFAVSMMFW